MFDFLDALASLETTQVLSQWVSKWAAISPKSQCIPVNQVRSVRIMQIMHIMQFMQIMRIMQIM